MAYAHRNKQGTLYYLHLRTAKNGKTPLYFFSKSIKEGAVDEMPVGYAVKETERTGLPVMFKPDKPRNRNRPVTV